MPMNTPDEKPKPTIKVVELPGEPKADKKAKAPIIENPGKIGAEIFSELVQRLKAEGLPMTLVRAKFRVETKALVRDKHLFGDEEAHESLLIFEGELERSE